MEEHEQYDYSIKELLEEAKNDPSWEPDGNKRAELTSVLFAALCKG